MDDLLQEMIRRFPRKKILKKNRNSSGNRFADKFFQLQPKGSKKLRKIFNLEDCLLSLPLQRQNTKNEYNKMSFLFKCPSTEFLEKMLNTHISSSAPGLQESIFTVLRAEVKHALNPLDKYCILLFGEMRIQPNLHLNLEDGTIIGFEDFGDGDGKRTQNIADYVQVYILKGINKNWEHVVYYHFVNGRTNALDIEKIITIIAKKCEEIGLKLMATVCDESPNNQTAINSLINKTKEENQNFDGHYFNIDNNKEILPLFNIPDLVRGIRNHLLNYNIKFNNDGNEFLAKWEHIFVAFQADRKCIPDDKYSRRGLMYQVEEFHVNPQQINKLKFSGCEEVFSQPVAAVISLYARFSEEPQNVNKKIFKVLKKEAIGTAHFIIFIRDILQSLNGDRKNFKLKKYMEHQKFWKEAVEKLNTFHLINDNNREFQSTTLLNLQRTLENFQILYSRLRKFRFDCNKLVTRTFNLDSIERFFAKIQQRKNNHPSPTAFEFKNCYKKLFVNGLASNNAIESNIEEDKGEIFLSLQQLIDQKNLPSGENIAEKSQKFQLIPSTLVFSSNHKKTHSSDLVVKYLIGKFKNSSCSCDFSNVIKEDILEDNTGIPPAKRLKLEENKPVVLKKIRKFLKSLRLFIEHNLYKSRVFFQIIHKKLLKKLKLNQFCYNHKISIFVHLILFSIEENCRKINNQLQRISWKENVQKYMKNHGV